MATKTKKAGSAPRSGSKPTSAPLQIIVRRGALRRFDSLKRATAELPVVLTWDRRTGERRSAESAAEGERRKGDRRQKPQFTWQTADFVVVEPAPAEAEAEAPKARKKR